MLKLPAFPGQDTGTMRLPPSHRLRGGRVKVIRSKYLRQVSQVHPRIRPELLTREGTPETEVVDQPQWRMPIPVGSAEQAVVP